MVSFFKKHFYFGEKVEGFRTRVLNEREVRASDGLFFFFSMIVFFNGFILGNFLPLKLFVIVFTIDFFIRVFINPKYSPSLILGKIITSNQSPEYVSAAPKKFAWILGLIIASIMFYLNIISNVGFTPLTCILCIICVILLFFESCFGICIGCYIYIKFKNDANLICPGDIYKIKKKEEIQKTSWIQILIVILFILLIIFFVFKLVNYNNDLKNNSSLNNQNNSFFMISENDCFLNNNKNVLNESLINNNTSTNNGFFNTKDCIFH